MAEVTVKNLIATIIKYRKELQYECSCAEDGILYLDVSGAKPVTSVKCVTYTALDGTEIVLDVTEDGFVSGIEFC